MFINTYEKAFREDKTTRVLLIVPARRSRDWFKRLVKSEEWQLVCAYSPGNELFSRPKPNTPIKLGIRENYAGTREVITVWELNDDRTRYEPIQW